MGHKGSGMWPPSLNRALGQVGELLREPSSWAARMKLGRTHGHLCCLRTRGNPVPSGQPLTHLAVGCWRRAGPSVGPSLGPCLAEKPFPRAALLDGGPPLECGWEGSRVIELEQLCRLRLVNGGAAGQGAALAEVSRAWVLARWLLAGSPLLLSCSAHTARSRGQRRRVVLSIRLASF